MSTGKQGYIEFRNGQKLWTILIMRDGELYRIRLDQGMYHDVDQKGHVNADGKPHQHDVVKFNPSMKWLESKKHFIPSEIRLC